MSTVIKVERLSKNFKLPTEKVDSLKGSFVGLFKSGEKEKTLHALRDIDFEVQEGEFFGIVGRNGSGKSTLLKILAGIYQPTSGSVAINGKLVPFIELGVGFNPQLTGKENVYLNGAMLGFSVKEVAAMYKDIVSFAELEQFMDQKLKNYSSGMQVRLAFSMAIRSEADILLIDEVLAVGDADFQRKCFEYFKKLKRNKKTVVFVSHDMSAIREYCDRVILIDDSNIVSQGSADLVATKYVKLFMDNELQQLGEQNTNRWGDGSITTKNISITINDNLIVITHQLVVNQDVDSPVVGIRVRDVAGANILGTNTKVENKDLGTFKSGDEFELVWTFPNILSDGQYLLDPAILKNDAITVADWWDEARVFRIKKARHVPYPVDPGFKISAKKM